MPWDPVRDLLTMQERLESLFGRASPGWVPPVDLSEDDDRYLLTVEVSGLNREDVKIEFADGTLTIRGGRPESGLLSRTVPAARAGPGPVLAIVPVRRPVDPDRIIADLNVGVLTVTVPKAVAARPENRGRISMSSRTILVAGVLVAAGFAGGLVVSGRMAADVAVDGRHGRRAGTPDLIPGRAAHRAARCRI